MAFPPAWSCVHRLDIVLRFPDCTCGGRPNQRSSPHWMDWCHFRRKHRCLRRITDDSCGAHRLFRQKRPNASPSNQWNCRPGSLLSLLRSCASTATPISNTQKIDGPCDVVRDHTGDCEAAHTARHDWMDHLYPLARRLDLRRHIYSAHIPHECNLRSADQYLLSTAVRHRRESNLAKIY